MKKSVELNVAHQRTRQTINDGYAVGGHRANENLTNYGRRVFYYYDENQLRSVTVSNAWRSEFDYDGMMRRRIRKEYTWQSSAWLKTNEVRYVYDGRLVIQERDTNNLALMSYTRGNDMSGSLQGAGGIGGLLARTAYLTNLTPSVWSAFYHADGNGNITAMVNPSGNRVAQYHYDPYGTLLASSGPLAEANTYRFSSKEYHLNSGLVYYLYRYYDSSVQRWVNRDPIEEEGGLNLFEFGGNEPISEYDSFGFQSGPSGGGMSKPIIFPQKPIPVFKLPKVKPPKPPVLTCPKPASLKGTTSEAIDKTLKEGNWTAGPTKTGGGTKYVNPDKLGEQIRVMPGNPNDPNPVKRGPYCRVASEGELSDPIPLKGNPELKL